MHRFLRAGLASRIFLAGETVKKEGKRGKSLPVFPSKIRCENLHFRSNKIERWKRDALYHLLALIVNHAVVDDFRLSDLYAHGEAQAGEAGAGDHAAVGRTDEVTS